MDTLLKVFERALDPDFIRERRQQKQLEAVQGMAEAFGVMGQQAQQMAQAMNQDIIDTLRGLYEPD